MIRLENISKQYKNSNEEIALKSITHEFVGGLIHGVIGISGAGKSTLIRLFNKLETYDDGMIDILEYKDIRKLNKESTRMLRKRIGMIFQTDHLLMRKTVFENVVFPIKLHRKITESDVAYANQLIEEVGLKGYESRYPSQLSGGQRQRVGIARVLMNKPEMLLCDEPTSALDVITTHQILMLIKTVAKNHRIDVLIVTHNMSVIKKICDTVTVMDKGEIIETGYVDDILYKAKHPTTKSFIKEIGLDLTAITSRFDANNLLLLKFDETIVSDSIISRMTNEINVNTSIVYANVSPNQRGIMVLYVPIKQDAVTKYLRKEKVVVEHVV